MSKIIVRLLIFGLIAIAIWVCVTPDRKYTPPCKPYSVNSAGEPTNEHCSTPGNQ